MALGREMDDRVDAVIGDQGGDARRILDVAFDEMDAVQALQIGAIARISERVEHDDPVLRMGLSPEADEVRADEAGASGHEKISHGPSIPERSAGD